MIRVAQKRSSSFYKGFISMNLLSTALADTILARYPNPDTIPYRR